MTSRRAQRKVDEFRRRAERQKGRTIVGDGMIASTQGQPYAAADARATFPEPTPGEHLWIVTAVWLVANPGAISEDNPSFLDAENLAYLGVGCYVCEQPWTPEMAGTTCPGELP